MASSKMARRLFESIRQVPLATIDPDRHRSIMPESHPIVIVGAGLAGLSCAVGLHEAGCPVQIFEASDRPGGRVRTDPVSGFRVDRGFQVLNTAYAKTLQILDVPALRPGTFEPGAMIRIGPRWHRVSDPLRRPLSIPATLRAPVGSIADKLRILRLRHHCLRLPDTSVWQQPAKSTREHLESFGFSPRMMARFFKPFYGGVFLETELRTSSRLFDFTFRMFAKGTAVLPAGGMEAIPAQLAARIPVGRIRLGARVVDVSPTHVLLATGERFPARAVVVATEGDAARALVPGIHLPPIRWKSVTTLAFAAHRKPVGRPWLLLNGNGPVDGPILSVCCPSCVADGYAPEGRHLVTATVPGLPEPDWIENAARLQLRDWFGPDVESWETLLVQTVRKALPEYLADAPEPVAQKISPDGIHVTGDHLHHPSIEGAVLAGSQTAEKIISGLPD